MSFQGIFTKSDDDRDGQNFGFVMAGFLTLVTCIYWWRQETLYIPILVISALFLVVAVCAPRIFLPIRKLWVKFGLILSKITNPVFLFILFLIAFVPIGWLLKLFRYDPLCLGDASQETFWIKREKKVIDKQLFKDQF